MTVVVTTAVILRRNAAHGVRRVATAQFAGAGLGLFGQRSRSWTKLKTRTIILTGEYPLPARLNPSLTIGGRAVKILADEQVLTSAKTNNPLDWEWEDE